MNFFSFLFFVALQGNTWNDVDRYICSCFGYGQTKRTCCLSNPHRHFIKHSNMYLWNNLILCKHSSWNAREIPWEEGNALSSQARWFVLFHIFDFSRIYASLWKKLENQLLNASIKTLFFIIITVVYFPTKADQCLDSFIQCFRL